MPGQFRLYRVIDSEHVTGQGGRRWASPTRVDDFTGRVVGVTDGDTITVLDAQNKPHKILLWGIDAPEHYQAFGTRAKDALAEKIFDQVVLVEVHDIDRYGQTVGVVALGKGM